MPVFAHVFRLTVGVGKIAAPSARQSDFGPHRTADHFGRPGHHIFTHFIEQAVANRYGLTKTVESVGCGHGDGQGACAAHGPDAGFEFTLGIQAIEMQLHGAAQVLLEAQHRAVAPLLGQDVAEGSVVTQVARSSDQARRQQVATVLPLGNRITHATHGNVSGIADIGTLIDAALRAQVRRIPVPIAPIEVAALGMLRCKHHVA